MTQGAERGKPLHRESRIHEVLSLGVSAGLSMERMNETEIVNQSAQFWEKVRSHLAALAPRLEIPERLRDIFPSALRTSPLGCWEASGREAWSGPVCSQTYPTWLTAPGQ